MDKNPKKKSQKKDLSGRSRDAQDQAVGGLARCVLETLKENFIDENEAFENYALQLRIRLFKDENSFCDRLAKGYGALLSEINKS